ncbi:hypothetical protein COU89_00420 [Candidatus Roizmanbacteria bacterium CG10_big_fil_rev_8_21_14_0_10_45_7]|uniref:Uncharacterized protein n=1 Tax=Candidatus Roizmanbacteria bacterium CG10_big_fil_rev_8_21_14_0_10_45_7 TaxID=1974854 RepID=A0A2M8KVL1_9BACT|nr:MAG: hypothetical protein COU89_00420 [Candidatus Roizmanbacteria bacterium CG10_big_fil_rev_8_21_14_0_10_45_7]
MRYWYTILLFLLYVFSVVVVRAEVNLSNYCKDGWYNLPGFENNCSRAPQCGGVSYEETENMSYDWNRCLGDGKDGRGGKACAGIIPACCYALEKTGNALMCNWPERGYCHPTQCEKIQGNRQNCGSPIKTWCLSIDGHDSIPYISLEQRMGLPPTQPTSTTAPTQSPVATPTTGVTLQTPTNTIAPTRDDRPRGSAPTVAVSPLPVVTIQFGTVGQSEIVIPTDEPEPIVLRIIDFSSIRTAVPPEVVVKNVAYALDSPRTTLNQLLAIDKVIEGTTTHWFARLIQFMTLLVQ